MNPSKAVSARRLMLAALLASFLGSPPLVQAKVDTVQQNLTPPAATLPIEGDFPSLAGATEWLNSKPLTPAGLRGKVVLVDFWTYSCVNWRRTLPYVRAWATKYKDKGLVVIGVHTPEFAFEKDAANIRWAIEDMHVPYPVAVDSDFKIWNAFGNEYWPALYLIDARSHIRYHQFGEGDYDRSERAIQQVLAEGGTQGAGHDLVSVVPRGDEVAADWDDLQSPETYLGFGRAENFASPGGAVRDERHVYAVPARLTLNQWALTGEWTVQKGAAALLGPTGRIVYRFHARDVNLVMGPATHGARVRFRLLIDGQPPGSAHGVDVDAQGGGMVIEQRMYQLIRHPKPIVEREVAIEFLDPGAEAFVFTFG